MQGELIRRTSIATGRNLDYLAEQLREGESPEAVASALNELAKRFREPYPDDGEMTARPGESANRGS